MCFSIWFSHQIATPVKSVLCFSLCFCSIIKKGNIYKYENKRFSACVIGGFLDYINKCSLLSVSSLCNRIPFTQLCLSKLCFLMKRQKFIPLRSDTVSRSHLNFNSSVWEGLKCTHTWMTSQVPTVLCCRRHKQRWQPVQTRQNKNPGLSSRHRALSCLCDPKSLWRQWGRFPSTAYIVVYLLCKHSGLYIWHTAKVRWALLLERDVTCRVFGLFLFSAEEAIWHIQWSTITNPVSHGQVSQKEAVNLQDSKTTRQKCWHYHLSFLNVLDSALLWNKNIWEDTKKYNDILNTTFPYMGN